MPLKCQSSKLRALTPCEATNSPVNRVAPAMDRARQLLVDAGLRPYRVVLCWTYASGDFRGEGFERVYYREELLPTPKVDGLDGIQRTGYSAGSLPVGTIRLSRVSITYSEDFLMGRTVPEPFAQTYKEPQTPPEVDFFYEVFEDGRIAPPLGVCFDTHPPVSICATDAQPNVVERMKFRVSSPPSRRPLQWLVGLERISDDMDRAGDSKLDDADMVAETPNINGPYYQRSKYPR